MSVSQLIGAILIFSLVMVLSGCAGTTPTGLLPSTDLEVRNGPCGMEFHGDGQVTTDVAVGETGYRWEQTTTTSNKIYKPCKETSKE